MVDRRALDGRLTSPSVKILLETLSGQDEKDDVVDVARFLCLYVCHVMFFPHAKTIPWVYLTCVED